MIDACAVDYIRRAIVPAEVTDALARQWRPARSGEVDLRDCRVERLYPRTASRFHVLYRLQHDRGDGVENSLWFADIDCAGDTPEARADHARARLSKPRRHQLDGESDRGEVAAVPALCAVWRAWGLDERLMGLGPARNPAHLLTHADRPTGLPDCGLEWRLLAHRLGKRCVGSLHGPDGVRAIVKFYAQRSGRADRAFEWMTCLERTDGSPPIARTIARLPDLQGLVLEHVDDECAHAPTLAASAAKVIRRLHEVPLRASEHHTCAQELSLLTNWTSLAAAVFPRLAQVLETTFARVQVQFARMPPACESLVHRDFYPAQVLLGKAGPRLIDFDTLALGDPALDVGNYLAHLDLELNEPSDAVAAFLDAYGARGSSEFAERVAAYRNASRLRLACLHLFGSERAAAAEALLSKLL